MNDIKCDIILPVCDQFKFTKDCIDSIVSNTLVSYRIIVINNGKNKDTEAYLAEMKRKLADRLLLVQNETNVGWVKALNQGICISSAPFLCFQNDDTVVTRGWLKKMIRILEENEDIGLVNPSWEGRPKHMSIEAYGALVEKRYAGRYIETDWARGFSVVFKREVVDRIGNVDEIFGLAYFDDVDFSVRAIQAGFLVALAIDTYVYHHRNVTFFEVLKGKKWNELHEKNKHIYYRRWGRPLKIAVILDKPSCENKESLNRIRQTIFYLARRQHHIVLWAPPSAKNEFQHTNIKFKSYIQPFLQFLPVLELYANCRKKAEKRYSAIFSFDHKFGQFIRSVPSMNKMPIYIKAPNEDFNAFVRKEVDVIKEKTKELERDEL